MAHDYGSRASTPDFRYAVCSSWLGLLINIEECRRVCNHHTLSENYNASVCASIAFAHTASSSIMA